MVRTPMAVIYVTSLLTYEIGRRVVTLPHISLVNLAAGRKVVEEFVQRFDDKSVATTLMKLVYDDEVRHRFQDDFTELAGRLQGEPAVHAGEVIKQTLFDR